MKYPTLTQAWLQHLLVLHVLNPSWCKTWQALPSSLLLVTLWELSICSGRNIQQGVLANPLHSHVICSQETEAVSFFGRNLVKPLTLTSCDPGRVCLEKEICLQSSFYSECLQKQKVGSNNFFLNRGESRVLGQNPSSQNLFLAKMGEWVRDVFRRNQNPQTCEIHRHF